MNMPNTLILNSKMNVLLRIGCVSLLGLLATVHTAQPAKAQGTLNITPLDVTLNEKEGKELKIEPAIPEFDAAKLRVAIGDEKLVEFNKSTMTVTAKDRGLTTKDEHTTLTFTYDPDGTPLKAEVKVTVKSRAKKTPVVVIRAGTEGVPIDPVTNTLRLVQGASPIINLKYQDQSGANVFEEALKLLSDKPAIVDAINEKPPKLHALNGSAEEATISVIVGNESAPRSELAFKVKVTGAIEDIEIDNGQVLSLPEGDSLELKVTIKGKGGAVYDLSQRPDIKFDVVESTAPNLLNVAREGSKVIVTARPLPVLPAGQVAPAYSARIRFGTNTTVDGTAVSEDVVISITKKFGHITFEPPPRGLLLPTGAFTTTAVVREKTGGIIPGQGVIYELENKEENNKWVFLAPEGNKLNVYWADPPAGNTTRRPSQVRVNVKAYTADGGVINGSVYVRMAEVTGFAPLSVKITPMADLQAADLYGKRTAEEFHVLIVRLFNDLKDQQTNTYIGSSILAYSSSMEIAVGLEKKFKGNESKSYFPSVLSKDAARRIAKIRADNIAADSQAQALNNQNEIRSAQTKLDEAARQEFELANKVAKLTFEAQRLRLQLIDAQRKYRAAATDAERQKIEENAGRTILPEYGRVYDELEKTKEEAAIGTHYVKGLKESITNRAATASAVSKAYADVGGAYSAVDDGLWHTVSKEDIERLAEQDAPPLSLSFSEAPLERISDLKTEIRLPPARSNARPEPQTLDSSPTEPECRSTIKYRPFTFEMMVNTVDRRDGRSFRTGLFKVLEGVGTATSFVTAIAVPGSGSDLPLGLDKYKNLLLPGAERLYSDFKEQNRQNLVSQAMKEIEEIPFGSDITRVLFIPKKSIEGLVRGHDVRISEVCPFYFKVNVAIVQKAGAVQQGTITR